MDIEPLADAIERAAESIKNGLPYPAAAPLAEKLVFIRAVEDNFDIVPELKTSNSFVKELYPSVIDLTLPTSLYPSVCLAQACLESGWGKYAKNSVFGIKGQGKTFRTEEVIDGKTIHIEDSFRQYATYHDAVADYVALLHRWPRYKPVLDAPSAFAACTEIQKAGYATDPNYPAKLRQIITDNGFMYFDALKLVIRGLG